MGPTQKKEGAENTPELPLPVGGYEGNPEVISLGDLEQTAWIARAVPSSGIVIFSQSTHEQGAVGGYWAQSMTRFGITTVLLELLSPHETQMEQATGTTRLTASPGVGPTGGLDRLDAYGLARRLENAIDWIKQKFPNDPIAVCALGRDGARAALRRVRAGRWHDLAALVLVTNQSPMTPGPDEIDQPPVYRVDLGGLLHDAAPESSQEGLQEGPEAGSHPQAVDRVSAWLLEQFHRRRLHRRNL